MMIVYPFERVQKHERLPYWKGLELQLDKQVISYGGKEIKLHTTILKDRRAYLFIWALVRSKGKSVHTTFLSRWLFEDVNNLSTKGKSKIIMMNELVNEHINPLLKKLTENKLTVVSGGSYGYYLSETPKT